MPGCTAAVLKTADLGRSTDGIAEDEEDREEG